MVDLKIKQGEDEVIRQIVTDDADAPVDLSTATKIHAHLYVNKAEVAKFSTNTGVDIEFEAMTVDGGDPTMLVVPVTREMSQNFRLGLLNLVVDVTLPDADLPDGRRQEYEFEIGEVIAGKTRTEADA